MRPFAHVLSLEKNSSWHFPFQHETDILISSGSIVGRDNDSESAAIQQGGIELGKRWNDWRKALGPIEGGRQAAIETGPGDSCQPTVSRNKLTTHEIFEYRRIKQTIIGSQDSF